MSRELVHTVTRLLTLAGLDEAVFHALVWRATVVLAGLATLKVVASFLTGPEQGFYFTFSSLLGIRVFVDLSFSYVVSILVSHQAAGLRWSPQRFLVGDPEKRQNLGILFRIMSVWYLAAGGLLIITAFTVGTLFFQHTQEHTLGIFWYRPWAMLCVASGLSLMLTPLYALLEGCGEVALTARLRTGEVLSSSVVFWAALASGFGLNAAALVPATQVFYQTTMVLFRRKHFFRDVYQAGRNLPVAQILREAWPLQWRVGVSAMSGYFIFNFLNPLVFAHLGAIEAGQIGMSMALLSALSTAASTWVNTKSPTFVMLIAKKNYGRLDELFFRSLGRGSAVMIAGTCIIMILIARMRILDSRYADRVLGLVPFACLAGTYLANYVVFALAVYLRAHRTDPFVSASVATGLLVAGSTWLASQRQGVLGVCVAYLCVTVISSTYATSVFMRCRRRWHGETTGSQMFVTVPFQGS